MAKMNYGPSSTTQMKPRYKWTPLSKVTSIKPLTEKLITEQMRLNNLPREKVIALLEQEVINTQLWVNDLYQVAVRVLDPETKLLHLNIRRRDGGAIMRDWRHFQRIKNELVGPECEAIELYPAESRLVDTSNKYHLIAVADPTFRFPCGDIFGNVRDVQYVEGNTPGTRQRSL